jgi:proteasome accessory factor B
VVSRRGRWYVVGHDLDRDDIRVFRLSRIAGAVVATGPAQSYEVPPDVDLRAQVDTFDSARPTRTATLHIRRGAGHGLRRRAPEVTPGDADGFDTVTVPFGDSWALAEEIASYGAAVVVLDPADVREAVVKRLGAVMAGNR